MNDKMNVLLASLDMEIDRKCFESKEKQHEKHMKRVFAACCLLFIVIPVTLIFFGLTLILFITWLAIFVAISAAFSLPIVICSDLEVFYDE